MYVACGTHATYMHYVAFIQYVAFMQHIACIQHACSLHLACIQHACSINAACMQLACNMHTTCMLQACYMLYAYSKEKTFSIIYNPSILASQHPFYYIQSQQSFCINAACLLNLLYQVKTSDQISFLILYNLDDYNLKI